MSLKGSETPRVFTPPLRELTPETSLGFSVLYFAKNVLGMTLFPWQKWLLTHMLELREDGRLRFRTVVVLVARQNGKSTISVVLALWALYVLGVKTVLGTAQDLDTAEEVWETAVDLATEVDDDDQPVRPDLAALVQHVVRVNGKKALVLRGRRRYKVKAANRRAGRGLTGDLVLLDELREHQSWDAYSAITKTTTAKASALVVCLSNAGDVTSVVLRHLRKLAHRSLGDPDGICKNDPADDEEVEDDDSLGLFEWSAAPDCSVWDREGWAQSNPSLGYTVQESTLRAYAASDPEWVMRTESLCQWSDGLIAGPFPAGKWEACAVPTGPDGVPLPGEVIVRDSRTCAGVATSYNRSRAYVAVAGFRADGHPQVELTTHQVGDEWLAGWLTEPSKPWRRSWQVAVEKAGESATASLALKAAGLRVEDVSPAEVKVGWGLLFDAVRDGRLRHRSQPILNGPASAAVVHDGRIDTRRLANGDPAALVAAQHALWLLLRPRKTRSVAATPPEKVQKSPRRHELQTIGF